MFRNNQTNKKRKSKSVKNLVGVTVLMGGLMIVGGQVSADELTSVTDTAAVTTTTSEAEVTSTVDLETVNVMTSDMATTASELSEEMIATSAVVASDEASEDVSAKVYTTATIAENNIGSTSSEITVDVKSNVDGTVTSGQYVDYTFDNINVENLNGKSVATTEGTTIGVLSVASNQTNLNQYVSEQDGEKLNPNNTYHTVVRLTFNEAVNTLKDISFEFSNTARTSNLVSSLAYEVTRKISSGDSVVATETNEVPAWVGPDQQNYTYKSENILYINQGVQTSSNNAIQFVVPVEKALAAGDLITTTIGKNSYVYNLNAKENQVGYTFDITSNRVPFADTAKNSSGVYVYNSDKLKLQVVSADDNKIVYKVIEATITADHGFGINQPTVVTDPTINNDSTFNYSLEFTRDGAVLAASGNRADGDTIVSGTYTNGNAVVVTGTHTTKWMDRETNQELEPAQTTEGKVTDTYDSVRKDFKDYIYVSVDGVTSGNYSVNGSTTTFYYVRAKGTVDVTYHNTVGDEIKSAVVDTVSSPVGTKYDTSDHKPSVIMVTNADGTTTVWQYKELGKGSAKEVGDVVKGNTRVDYVYAEAAVVPVKDMLDKEGRSINGKTVTTGDIVTIKIDGNAISDSIDGGLTRFGLKDILDTLHLEYVDNSVKLIAGKDTHMTLSDGSVIKSGDDVSRYVDFSEKDGEIVAIYKAEFLKMLADNDVEDMVNLDLIFDAKVVAAGDVENTAIEIINDSEFTSESVKFTVEEPQKDTPTPSEAPKADTPTVVKEQSVAVLPSTGETGSVLSVVSGLLSFVAGLFGVRKRKED